jgi:hypothetical protein
MKTLSAFPLTVFLALALTACPSTGGSGTPALTSLSGQISNWPAGKLGTLGTVIIASGTPSTTPVTQSAIDANGKFNLDLPSTAVMAPLISGGSITNPCTGVTATANVKGAGLGFILQNTSKTTVGNPSLASTDPSVPGTTTLTSILYFYVDSDWNASGTCTSTGGSTTQTFNVQAKAGWNIIIGNFTQGNATFTSGAIPVNVKWIASGDLTKLGLKQFNFNQFFSR